MFDADQHPWEGETVMTCKHCDAEKPESEMAIRGGKPSRVCIECKENGRPKKRAKRKAQAPTVLELTVPGGGHGFKAVITDEDTLLVTQENPDTEADNVVFTRHEAKALFDRFGEWIIGEAA